MAKIIVDVSDKTKAILDKRVAREKMSLKAYVLLRLELVDA